jgi:hypothetical protein
VLAAKANQEDVMWFDYIFCLYVSYRRLNQIVRPFAFPIYRCDDTVADILSWAKFFLSFDLDCGYWQVELDAESRERTAFFTPNGKMHLTVMPMGFLNSHAIFVAMMEKLKEKLNKSAGHMVRRPHQAGAKVIVDDVILYSNTSKRSLKSWSSTALPSSCRKRNGWNPNSFSSAVTFRRQATLPPLPSLLPSKVFLSPKLCRNYG